MIFKNKKLCLSIGMIIICLVSIAAINLKYSAGIVAVNKVIPKNHSKKIILIDPGHGGIDGGAVSASGLLEKDINLKISMKLKAVLEKQNYTVLMTRTEDTGLYSDKGTIHSKKIQDLNNRCKMKIESDCDIFVSIHLNMFPQSQYYGAQVWYSDYPESKKLGELIQEDLRENLDPNNKRMAKCAKSEYKILSKDGIPSVIVECGFLSNAAEAQKLADDAYQDKIAASVAASISKYFKSQDSLQ